MSIHLKLWYSASTVCGLTVFCSSICHSAFCLQSATYSAIAALYVSVAVYMGVLLCRLGTLLCRLHTTFKDTVFKMSRNTRIGFGVVFGIMVTLCIIAVCISPFVSEWYHDWPLLIIVTILYFITAAIAVARFTRNLLKLAKSRAKSSTNVLASVQIHRTPTLTQSQQRLLDMTARVVLLFIVQTLVTFVALIILLLEIIPDLQIQVTMLVAGVDCTINHITLILSYKFAKKWYSKCCNRLDLRCKRIVEREMLRLILDGQNGLSRMDITTYDECPAEEDEDEPSEETIDLKT